MKEVQKAISLTERQVNAIIDALAFEQTTRKNTIDWLKNRNNEECKTLLDIMIYEGSDRLRLIEYLKDIKQLYF